MLKKTSFVAIAHLQRPRFHPQVLRLIVGPPHLCCMEVVQGHAFSKTVPGDLRWGLESPGRNALWVRTVLRTVPTNVDENSVEHEQKSTVSQHLS